jgi:hypothetical protein
MATYQCFFFEAQRIGYWENVVAEGDHSIRSLLEERVALGDWEAAEAWRDDALICRTMKRGLITRCAGSED